MIPGLSKAELDYILSPEFNPRTMPDELFKKIQNHALKRIDEGKSPFFKTGE